MFGMTCDQCTWFTARTTGRMVFIHEKGCPNEHKEWDAVEAVWVKPDLETESREDDEEVDEEEVAP